MGDVIHFPPRLRLQPTAEQIGVRQALTENAISCPHCIGRGWVFRMTNLRGFFPDDFETAECPCGGDDENRIDVDGPDYPGAA